MKVEAAAAADDDMSGDGMQCSDHPYRNNSSPGGICPLCLQDKLGKLVSSSSSFTPSSSSPSPSFRSSNPAAAAAAPTTSSAVAAANSLSLMVAPASNTSSSGGVSASISRYQQQRVRVPFLLANTQKKKKKGFVGISPSTSCSSTEMVLKRSKSTATPRSGRYFSGDFSPRRRGFWSFLHLSVKKPNQPPKVEERENEAKPNDVVVVVEEDDNDSSPNSSSTTSFGRKVSRSRSVGCGSRSFSGDLFERISTGFGDCTLRRVESQREGRRASSASRASGDHIKERVRCGGLFGGFMITSSSSSSSSSSYWIENQAHHHHQRVTDARDVHARSRSWGWAFASPMRAFGGKPRREIGTANKNTGSTATAGKTPDLAAIPSLLAVRGYPIAGDR